jgi:predicted transcriptional regulator
MKDDLLAPLFLFKLIEAAGISKTEIATRLGVSKTLVTLWSQAKRTIGWSHYESLMDLASDPNTIWKIAQRLKKEKTISGPNPFQELTPSFLVYKIIGLSVYYRRRTAQLYADIKSITHQLAECTSGEPATWDIPALQRLSNHLADDLKDAPLLTMQFEPRLEKALRILKEALGDANYQEHTDATTHSNGEPSGEFNSR